MHAIEIIIINNLASTYLLHVNFWGNPSSKGGCSLHEIPNIVS